MTMTEAKMMCMCLLLVQLSITFFVFMCCVGNGNARTTSTFVRSEFPSVDIPLDNKVFAVPKGYNAPQQVSIQLFDSNKKLHNTNICERRTCIFCFNTFSMA